jgi:hypothetical protein
MRRIISLAGVLLLFAAGVWAQQQQKPPAGKVSAEQSAPPPPATLLDRPPVPPVVRMQNGMLSIDAPNSILGDILRGIQAATGAIVEGPSPSDRVAVKLGPADARDVIAALLRGSAYNYIILGSPENPRAVTRIVLTQASPPTGRSAAAFAPQPAPPPPEADEYSPADSGDEATVPAPAPAPAPEPPVPPVQAPQAGTESQQQNHPPTPEELFRQLLPTHPQQQTGQN